MHAPVRQVRRELGGPEAFPDFYEQTLPRIYGYFLRRCEGVVAVAEDLTQETYLAAARELKRRRSVDAPIPWLYGIARHKLLDHYRHQRRVQDNVVPWHDGLDESVGLPCAGAEAMHDWVAEALARLPAGQRTVVVLRYLDGLSVPEVAATVGKSVHAVESLLARGRANLKRALSESAHE